MYTGLDGDPTCLSCGHVEYDPDDLAASYECADKMHAHRAENRRESLSAYEQARGPMTKSYRGHGLR